MQPSRSTMQTREQAELPSQLEFDFGAPVDAPAGPRPEPLLTITEACRLYNLKPHVLRKAIKRGDLKTYRIGNGRIRVRASDIEALILASVGGAK